MRKIFLLSLGIMIGIIIIIGIVFINITPNNNSFEETGYQIKIISSGSWKLEIISQNNKTLEKYEGSGNKTINLENKSCIPNYNLEKSGNTSELIIQILLNGKVIEEKKLSKNEIFLENKHEESTNNHSNTNHIRKYKNRN
ncbi:hypothetical protein [Methanobrevibacter sp. DSM 116169]|uniref:hypothetical protein n=1 Tax=Methanobrevibacter sp. DSM 116169 TaxID=3242727 RepID=UPI0038FC4BF6